MTASTKQEEQRLAHELRTTPTDIGTLGNAIKEKFISLNSTDLDVSIKQTEDVCTSIEATVISKTHVFANVRASVTIIEPIVAAGEEAVRCIIKGLYACDVMSKEVKDPEAVSDMRKPIGLFPDVSYEYIGVPTIAQIQQLFDYYFSISFHPHTCEHELEDVVSTIIIKYLCDDNDDIKPERLKELSSLVVVNNVVLDYENGELTGMIELDQGPIVFNYSQSEY